MKANKIEIKSEILNASWDVISSVNDADELGPLFASRITMETEETWSNYNFNFNQFKRIGYSWNLNEIKGKNKLVT